MPQCNLYVFKEPRSWKGQPAETVPFMYSSVSEVEQRVMQELDRDGVYHVTAFNTYSQLITEAFKSRKTKWKVQ
jgi:hypothetical protein